MPGVNEAELKARRRRSAAQLTSSLPGTGTGNRVSSGPDLDPAVAGVSDQPKEKLEDNNIAADVIMADRTEDGCCARVSRCLSELTGREAAFTFSWSGSVTATAKLEWCLMALIYNVIFSEPKIMCHACFVRLCAVNKIYLIYRHTPPSQRSCSGE